MASVGVIEKALSHISPEFLLDVGGVQWGQTQPR
jgi:hypothetical protein